MRAQVKRCRRVDGEFRPKPDGGYKESQLTLSDNWAQLCGPQFGHVATGTVHRTSLGYPGSDYHLRVDVLIDDSYVRGTAHWERWFVRMLDVSW